ncbi:MAG: RNA pseudouridine synthase [Phycisphaerae bacterium]|nr:RNA pseudouridine synthase [Phycisphaerae bacterium]
MQLPSLILDTGRWLVIDKPAGWHSVRGATQARDDGVGVVETWLAAWRTELGALPESGLVHRLDRDTSGCLVVATDPEAHGDLVRRFRESVRVRKTYLARCRAALAEAQPAESGDVTLHFSSRYKGSAKVTVAREGEAKHAGSFRWRVLARDDVAGDLLELDLLGPGKRHQLRAGCAFLGFPLVGDTLYAGTASAGLQLHAWRVVIDDRIVEAPPPGWAR